MINAICVPMLMINTERPTRNDPHGRPHAKRPTRNDPRGKTHAENNAKERGESGLEAVAHARLGEQVPRVPWVLLQLAAQVGEVLA
jgi:hypothetical protein